MKILVTGSSGHLGEALMRTLKASNVDVFGIDLLPSVYTSRVGSIVDREFVKRSLIGIDAVLHTATLHKPHVISHSNQDFIDTNITGTLNLLEEALLAGVRSFIFTSTTSSFGDALTPAAGFPAAWITEDVQPKPKNIYGVTKTTAEDICQLFHRNHGLACLILKTSRFFPEEDDQKNIRDTYCDGNVKANEFLYRRVELEDVVSAHLLALEKAPSIGFNRYIISATSPFTSDNLLDLRLDAAGVVKHLFPDLEQVYARHEWKMFPSIERVYVNEKARMELGWKPKYDFRLVLSRLKEGIDPRSDLSKIIGSKGYHPQQFQ
jgi:UDP-glucose 4-epimerase